jgi:hypothetical protein
VAIADSLVTRMARILVLTKALIGGRSAQCALKLSVRDEAADSMVELAW